MNWLPVQIVKPARKSWERMSIGLPCLKNTVMVIKLQLLHWDELIILLIYKGWKKKSTINEYVGILWSWHTGGARWSNEEGLQGYFLTHKGGNCFNKSRKEKPSQTNIDLVKQWGGCYCCIDFSASLFATDLIRPSLAGASCQRFYSHLIPLVCPFIFQPLSRFRSTHTCQTFFFPATSSSCSWALWGLGAPRGLLPVGSYCFHSLRW